VSHPWRRLPRRLARHALGAHPAATSAGAVLAVAVAAVLGGVIVLMLIDRDARSADLVGSASMCLAAAAAAVIVITVDRAGLGQRSYVRRLAVALCLATVAAASWFVETLHASGDDLAGPHDLLYLAAGAVAVAAAAAHPDLGPARRRARLLVDAVIIATAATVVLWLLLGRTMWERSAAPLETAAAVLCVAAGLAVVRLATIAALERPAGSQAEATASLVALGFMGITLGGVLHLVDHASDVAPWVAVVGDAVVVVGFASIGVAGLLLLGQPRSLPFTMPRLQARSVLDLSPIVVTAVATIGVLVDAARRGAFDATASAVLTIVISAVLLRQSLTLSDNRGLSASLRATVDGLEQQATHDALTGLPNRSGLDDRLRVAARRAALDGSLCAVFFVDVDHLKAVNDSLGHRAGDLLLRVAGERLTARVGTRVTRFGGDEFVLVVEDFASPTAAEELGRRIVDDLSRPIELEGHHVRSSASVGLTFADLATSPEELLRQADVALYRAKALGRCCIATYRAEEDESLGADLDLEPELRRALDRDEFTLHYQPVVDLATGAVVSVESLLRWEHPERGLLGPGAFLDHVISSGLLGAIGASSLQRACEDFASVGPHGSPAVPPGVAVNLSSSELADRRVVERVAAALSESGLPARRLTLEITEDVIIDETVRTAIDQLCELGVHLAIDDFGTGNSSLRQLGAYPADVLKIDKSFVDRLEVDDRARAITASIVRLARNLGLTTVAEGVETAGQADLLTRMGCDRAQGWLFAPAMPFDQLLTWCAAGGAGDVYRESRASVASASSMMRASSSATGGRSSIAPTT
jgi:diguanylate cyclase (GGDEF)-like protein